MADRLSQYSMMPNFNPSMLQPHQMQQQTSQQQHQDNHQPMPSFSEQSHLWSQMQHLQNQFRPNNGADVNSPQINQQMADLLRSQNMAARAHGQQQQSFPLGVPQMSAGPSGGPSQQPPFHDPSSQRQPVGFPNLVNGGGLQAPLSQNSMQARNAMMQAITNNQNHNRQLELIGMAANQQNQNGPMSFPSRLNAQQQPQQQQQQQPQSQSVNPPGQGDIFAPAMGANDALRRASPANPPTQMGGRPHQFTMAPNGMMRSQLPPELQGRIMSLRTVIGSGENNIRNLQNNRAGMSDVTYYAQLKTQQNEVAKAKEMLGRVIQLASNNNMHNMSLANQQSHQPSQPQWMQPASQASSFGNGQASHQPQQSNLQPSPSQHHSQPPPQSHNIPQMIPPNRSVSTSQHLPSQTPLGGIPFNMNTVTGGGQSGIPNGISNSFGPAHPPPLEKTRFEAAYMNYLTSKGLDRDVRTVATIEHKPVDIHALHTQVMQEGGAAKVAQKDLWAAIAARLGFVQFPGNDTEPAKSGPGTAHQLEQIYKDHLAHFDMVYVTTVLESRRKQQVSMAAQQLANPNPAKSMNGPQMQMVMAYADLSPAELRAKGVQEHIITFIENHRAHIQRTAAEQNLFRGNLRGASTNQPVQPPSEGITAAANNRQFTATPSQNPAGPSNPLGHVATSPPQFIPNPALQNGTTDGGMMEHRPHLPNNTIIPQFMRGNQEQLSRISSMLSQVKQDFLANRMAALGSVRVLPEERMAYNAVVEQLHRATGELENKLPMLYLFANGKNDVWVKRLAVIVVTVQQQRSFLASNNPRFIVNLDNLRLMLSEVQKGHERFNAMVQTIMAQQQQQQQQHQHQHQHQPPPPPPGGSVVNGPPASNMSRPAVSQQPNVIHHSQQVHQPQSHHHPNVPPNINRPPTVAPPTPSLAMKKKPIQPVSSSPAGVAAASPTPPPVPAASTPTPNASTPSATNSINIASSPRSPKVKAPNKPVKTTKRKISKASSTPTIEPAQPPNPMPTNGVKRPREEETPALSSTPSGASGSGAAVTPPSGPSAANEPSPPKKAKTEWEGPPNDALKKREETVENIRTEEDASQFLEQMTELIKMAGEGQESTLSSDISETLDMILKGYSAAPDGVDGTSTSSSVGEGSGAGGHEPTSSIPSADEFVEFFDFSLFETEANDDEGSKAPTPDLVSSSSTNPSPESGSEADPAHHALTFSDFKTDEPSDPLRLGTFKEVDGGESAYYQSTEWKWDGPMTTLDQPWAIFTSSS